MDIKGILEKMRAEGAIPHASTGAVTAENAGQYQHRQLALPGQVKPPIKRDAVSDSESSDSEPDERELPPGPIDPDRCEARGPGFAGAAAGAPVKLVITAKDSSGKRIREGGAYVQVYVEPASAAAAAAQQPERIDATITDHNDGTYTAFYTVLSKGNYKLNIDINGQPMGGSPFPVFFSAPEVPTFSLPVPPTAAPAAPLPTVAPDAAGAPPAGMPAPLAGAPAVSAAPQLPPNAAALFPGLAAAFPNLGGPAMNLSLGQQAAQAGVRFPTEDLDKLGRMLLVGGVSPFATPDQLRSVFGFCGTILGVELTGPANAYAFVEYGSAAEATAALAMNGVQLLGQHMNVENARAAKASAEAEPPPDYLAAAGQQAAAAAGLALAVANPFLSVQMQQLQQFNMLTQQQAALAEQVATMRAMQRAGGSAADLKLPLGSNDQQKSAAIAAAIALSKRLAGSKSGEAGAGGPAGGEAKPAGERKRSSRSRSRERGKRPRSRSKSRSRRDRSRERSRRDGSRERRRARSRSRSKERRSARRSSQERRDERDRDRDRKDRDKGKDKDVERGGRRDRAKDKEKDRDGERSSRRDRDQSEKERDRSKGRKASKRDRSRDKERDGRRDRSKEREKDRPEKEKGSSRREAPEAEGEERQQPSKGAGAEGKEDALEDLLNELGD